MTSKGPFQPKVFYNSMEALLTISLLLCLLESGFQSSLGALFALTG